MRLYLDSANFCLAAIEIGLTPIIQATCERLGASYKRIGFASILKPGLCTNLAVGSSGRPAALESELTTSEAFEHYLARHVRARAALLHNRAAA